MDLRKFITFAENTSAFDGTATNIAQISNESFCAGDVQLGQTLSKVISMYGQPKGERYAAGTGKIYSFGNGSAIFDIRASKQYIVEGIYIEGNCTLKTNAGIGINSTVKDLYITYGRPDNEKKGYNNSYLLSYKFQPSPSCIRDLTFETKSNLVIGIRINEYPCIG